MINHYTQAFRSLLIFAIFIVYSPVSLSEEFQSHNSIRTTAEKFLISQLNNNHLDSIKIEVSTGRLDPRLKLRQCELPLQPFLPSGASIVGNTSVGIKCDDHKPWSLYVSSKIIQFADVYVATRYLPRGSVLKKDDIALQRHNISQQSAGYITQLTDIEGKILRRPIPHSKVIPPNALHEPMLIKNGQKVVIVAQNSGVKVRMKGKALKNGAEGDIIRVQNLSSKRIVEGKVLSAGVVGVSL